MSNWGCCKLLACARVMPSSVWVHNLCIVAAHVLAAKMIVQCARLAMQIADVYEAEEHIQQGQGQQQQQQQQSEQAGPAGQVAADDAGNHESGQLQEEGIRSRRGKRQRSNSVESVGTRGTRSKPVSGALPGMGADKDVPSGKQAEAQPLASQEHAAGAPLATKHR